MLFIATADYLQTTHPLKRKQNKELRETMITCFLLLTLLRILTHKKTWVITDYLFGGMETMHK